MYTHIKSSLYFPCIHLHILARDEPIDLGIYNMGPVVHTSIHTFLRNKLSAYGRWLIDAIGC